MEIKFSQNFCRHLKRAVDQVQTQEQTQEVRLPDSMPDIGRVLGAWGKPLVRSKEWRSGSMAVSGGVMAWVLYAPEDGSEPRSMEVWLPYQLKWDFPETKHDGFICVEPRLKSIDARSISARKMMVRANISACGKGLETVETEIFAPQEVPEDVALLTMSYPMELPCEAGEKIVETNDDLDFSDNAEKVLRYDMVPVILEQKVMASRLVFRGKGMVHILYLSGDEVRSWDGEVFFSQFADLDREYSPNASAQVMPVMTNLELDRAENRLQLKCSMAAQYVIYDRSTVELVEDAYSNVRDTALQTQQLLLPMRLDNRREPMQVSGSLNAEAQKIVDVSLMSDVPQRQLNGDAVNLTVPGMFQVLYYDPAGNLQCGSVRFEQSVQLAADPQTLVDGAVQADVLPQAVQTGQGIEVSAALQMETSTAAQQGQQMVTGLELGEYREKDPQRPSLILRRAGDESLWEMAKEAGSTVEAICRANQIREEPEKGRMLLIPVC